MIEEVIVHRCGKCGSQDIHRNGHSEGGRQKYYCKSCKHHGRLREVNNNQKKEEEFVNGKRNRKDTILKAAMERCSLRGLQRIFRVGRETVMQWLKEAVGALKRLKDMVFPAEKGDVVEVDELWSFVSNKGEKRWIWTAICRRTRQIIAFTIGDRSEKAARRLWRNIPDSYKKKAVFYSDFWDPYLKVFPEDCHEAVGKETGQTAHMERWNCTLRQRLGRLTRKSLSFSKSDKHHYIAIRLFIDSYNRLTPVS